MPWTKMSEVPPSLKGVVDNLEDANEIAKIADAIDPKTVDNVWAVAISTWRKSKMKEFDPDTPVSELTEAQVRFVTKAALAEAGNWWEDTKDGVGEAPAEEPTEEPAEEPAEEPQGEVDFANSTLLYSGGKYYMAPNAGDGVAPKAQWVEVQQKWVPVQVEQSPTEQPAQQPLQQSPQLAKPPVQEAEVIAEAEPVEGVREDGKETEDEQVEEAEIVLIQETGEPAEVGEEVNVVRVQETDNADPQSPLRMLIEVIQPGWGNKRDGHYYPAAMLRQHAKVFEGAKMFTTDHDAKEHNARNEVSFIDKIVGFSDRGAPLAETVVYDPTWAHKVRNLASVGRLDRMHFSIYAKGVQKKGTVDGKDGWVVERILDDPKPYVDWVSNAGAGGQGIRILEVDRVREMLAEAKADEPIISRLLERDYQNEGEVTEALLKEREYLKEATGSGQPRLGGRVEPKARSLEERELKLQEIERRYGLRPANSGQ